MKYTLVITDPARQDIKDIKAYSKKTFGPQIAADYETLIKQALKDIAGDPFGIGSISRPEIAEGAWTYHVQMSRNRAGSAVQSPRHFVLYFEERDNRLTVSRVLHDSRDLSRHLPDEHRRIMAQAVDDPAPKPTRRRDRQR